MKQFGIIFLLVILSQPLLAQKERFKLSLSSGIYANANTTNVKPGFGIGLDVHYYLTDNIFVASHFNYGKFRYYEGQLTNIPTQSLRGDGTNANAESTHFGLLVGSNIRITEILRLTWATGISGYTIIKTFAYQTPEDAIISIANGITDVAFPLRFGIEINPWEKLSFGIISGFYGFPSSSIVGLHVGPFISYKL